MNASIKPASFYFDKCKGLGWHVVNKAGTDVLVSPRNTVISYNKKTGEYTSGVCKSNDFTKLINLLINQFGRRSHDHRQELMGTKLDTKELYAVLDVCQPAEDPSQFTNWVISEADGCIHLDYWLGPLCVSATIRPDNSWTVSLTDGGPCDHTESGTASDIHEAKLLVNETLVDWAEEVVCTGRFAMKLVSRIKGVIE